MIEPEPRAVLAKFSHIMEKKLRKNDHKLHWSKLPVAQLRILLYREIDELMQAIQEGSSERITEEAADVANISMMIADNCGGLK